ncbi:MAG: hypothetical protein ACK4EY_15215 [Flavipsychrobacter sp.]
MKKLITIALLTSATNLYAQPFSDSIENVIQKGIMYDSRSRLLCHFVDYDYLWLNNISMFLQLNGYIADNAPDKPGMLGLKLHKGNKKVSITGYYNDKTDKMKNVVITGTPDAVAELFVYYWEKSDYSINMLKKHGYFHRDFGSDRITFDWKGEYPTVRIIKNPDAPKISFAK